jgi:hypothetical protein
MQFLMDQMNLTQIWLTRISRHPRAMLHRCTGVRIAIDTQTFDQVYRRLFVLAEGMCCAATDRDNPTDHSTLSIPSHPSYLPMKSESGTGNKSFYRTVDNPLPVPYIQPNG